MKLKLGLLATMLVMAQAPINAGNLQPQQAAAETVSGQANQALPAGVTAAQQQEYDKLLVSIKQIATSIKTDIIPAVKDAITRGSFGGGDLFTIGTKLLFTIAPALASGILAVRDLHNTSPNARAIIKHNLANTFKEAQFGSLVEELKGLLGQLPDGIIKTKLIEYVPKLNELPELVAAQL